MTALTFWHVAGDIIWRGDGRAVAIDALQVRGLRELFRDELKAAHLAGADEVADRASDLLEELVQAQQALSKWERVVWGDRRAA